MNKIGTMNPHLVWLFALGATLLGLASGYVTQNAGTAISSAVYFGIFSVSAFGAMALTRAKALAGVGAFTIAALLSGGAYYFIVAAATAEAAGALGAGGEGVGAMGAVMGGFVAVVVTLGTFIAGITGVVAGNKFRTKALEGGPIGATA